MTDDKVKELQARIKASLKAMKDKRPFNSANMDQVPFEFFEEEDLLSGSFEDKEREVFASKYFNASAGLLHLGWDIDAYWTKVANEVMIPDMISIYDELVKRGHTEDNTCMYGDADGDIYWIPAANPKTKVIVHENQGRDYLYVLTEIKTRFKKHKVNYDFHIRKLWKNFNSMSNWRRSTIEDLYASTSASPPIDKKEFVETLLKNVPYYEEISDDDSEYPRRPSLEYYRKRKFNMGVDEDKKFNGIYGDCRDSGYVFSIRSDSWRPSRAEHTVGQTNQLEMISTCYLPSIRMQLGLPTTSEWDSKNG